MLFLCCREENALSHRLYFSLQDNILVGLIFKKKKSLYLCREIDDQEVNFLEGNKHKAISEDSNKIAKPKYKVLCLQNKSEEFGWISV